QIQAVCNGDSSAVSGDSFITPSVARSNNPKTYTINTVKGRLYDSGGTLGGYTVNESYLYRIIPSNGGRVELTFTTFETEETHDVLEIFDGQDTTGRKLGAFSGKTMPLGRPFVSRGNGLTLRFKSDNRTNAPGWTASWRTLGGGAVVDNGGADPPSNNGGNNNTGVDNGNNGGTTLPPAFGTGFDAGISYASSSPTTEPRLDKRYDASFTMRFNDKDRSGRGIVSRFYNVAQAGKDGYAGNPAKGFFYADFGQGLGSQWTSKTGTWQVRDGHLSQTNPSPGNTNLYASLTQKSSETYIYAWKARMTGNSGNLRHGIHFFCSAPANTNRGNSYFIWVRDGRSGDYIEIYKTYKDQF
ncbi:MAG: CUB domain-containing protein, partial [Bacteroidota bacterium]